MNEKKNWILRIKDDLEELRIVERSFVYDNWLDILCY
jgi:hypothetical protein